MEIRDDGYYILTEEEKERMIQKAKGRSLAEKNPELAGQWNAEKNGDLRPEMVTANSHKKVWWKFSYFDNTTGKFWMFIWLADIASRNNGLGCPYLSGRAVWEGFNDLQSKYPEIATEWHPTKNGELLPTMVTAKSHKLVWWLLPYDDPITGKHFDFEWQAVISSRVGGNGCPYLSNEKVWLGYNDLATTHPNVAKQWHPTKNGKLNPTDVLAGSDKKVWWYLCYFDVNTGKTHYFEWEALINKRALRGYGCPYLSGHAVWQGYNDLATIYPEILSNMKSEIR